MVIWSIWYHVPQKYERRYEVRTLEQEIETLRIDLTCVRTFWNKDRVFGTVELGSKKYKSIENTSNERFLERFQSKVNGQKDFPWFIDVEFQGSAMNAEKLIILNENGGFEEISFLQIGTENVFTNHYFGPARNIEETDLLARKFMGM